MEQLKIAEFLEENTDFLFPNNVYTELEVEDFLLNAPDSFEAIMKTISFRNPSVLQIISIFPGSLGVDRFYLGEIGKGILKYFTFGGVGIWWIADIVSAKSRCRAYNCKKLISAINDPYVVAKMNTVDSKISQGIDAARKYAPVAKELAKGAKDIGKTFDVNN